MFWIEDIGIRYRVRGTETSHEALIYAREKLRELTGGYMPAEPGSDWAQLTMNEHDALHVTSTLALGAWALVHGLSHLIVDNQLTQDLREDAASGRVLERIAAIYGLSTPRETGFVP